ncbi:hypothetical protein [Stenotrophomonas phage RAS14]
MRKIEAQLIEAIRQNREWSSGNTTFAGGLVLLHGHVIARKDGSIWQINLQGWNTATTRSRLTAILSELVGTAFSVTTKNGQAYINYRNGFSKAIASEGWHSV